MACYKSVDVYSWLLSGVYLIHFVMLYMVLTPCTQKDSSAPTRLSAAHRHRNDVALNQMNLIIYYCSHKLHPRDRVQNKPEGMELPLSIVTSANRCALLGQCWHPDNVGIGRGWACTAAGRELQVQRRLATRGRGRESRCHSFEIGH